MFFAVGYKNNKIAIFDDEDKTIEWWDTDTIKVILSNSDIKINGVILDEKINPIYTVNGLVINLYYLDSINIDRFRVSFLGKGALVGSDFGYTINQDSVAIFDRTSFPFDKYPNGQKIATYHVDTIMNHNAEYGLSLDFDVKAWKLTPTQVKTIQNWLSSNLERMRKNALY